MGQLLDGDLLGLVLGHAKHLARRQHNVFQHRQMREGVPLLEDDADLASQLVEIGILGVNNRAIDGDPPCVDRFQPVDAGQKRRLARPGATDDGDHLTLVHREVDPLQNLQRAEGFANVSNFNHWGTTVFRDTRQAGRWGS
jgi:hypothetical protein